MTPISLAQIISTVAGNGSENVTATSAQLNSPMSVAMDGSGNLYIADYENHRIRKVGLSGVITTVAGNGTPGYSGDGGTAIEAQLGNPISVAVDGGGNLYIASNNRIRKVNTAGVITTVAGNGTSGYSGDGGMATSAQLSAPWGVAVDGSGNLYVADQSNFRIRKVNAAGVITTVAGNGSYGYSGDGGLATSAQLRIPTGVAVDGGGNLYIADPFSACIRKVNTGGEITTVALVGEPIGVAVDGGGNLYIADRDNHRIRKVSTSGEVTTVAGSGCVSFFCGAYGGDGGPATSARLNYPHGVAVDGGGNLYIADRNNQVIRKVNTAGIITTMAGNGTAGYNGDKGPATSAYLSHPYGVAVSGSGDLYIADTYNSRIRKVNQAGVITTIAGTGSGPDTGDYSGDGGQAIYAQLHFPTGVAVGGDSIYIADLINQRIRKVNTSGVIATVAGDGTLGYGGEGGQAIDAPLNFPTSVALSRSGDFYIADQSNNRILKVNTSGLISTVAGIPNTYGNSGDGGPATSAKLYHPSGVVVDGSGNLFIADEFNHRIRKVSPEGVITTVAGNGTKGYNGDGVLATSAQLGSPSGVAVDGDGNLYIAENYNHRIRKVSTAGIITTVAGNGTQGYSGDGGQPISAQLNYPTGVAVDGEGNLYIADQGNDRIRKVILPRLGISINYPYICSGASFRPTAMTANFTPNSYSWSSQPAGFSATGATPTLFAPTVSVQTTYTITVTASDGTNTLTASAQVFVRPLGTIALSASGTLTCSQTSVTLVAGQGGGYSYQFQFAGPGIVNVSGNQAVVNVGGVYSVNAYTSSPFDCPLSQTITVETNTISPTATLASSGTLTCARTSVTLTAGGGSTYLFSGPGVVSQSGNAALVNAAGTYSVTVTAANGCTASQSITVFSDTAAPTATLAASGTITCTQNRVILTAGGGSTYFFAGPGVIGTLGNTALVDQPGTYTVTVPAANGCTAVATTTVIANTVAPSATMAASGTITCSQTSATLTAGGGTSYQFSGPEIVSQSGNIAVVNVGGAYSVTATGTNGCTASISTTVQSNTISPIATLAASGTLTCSQTNITLTAGGGSTYQFSGPGLVSQSGNQAVVSQAGIYSVTVTSSNGCIASQSITIQANTTGLLVTVKVGNWNDPTTWSCGRIPVITDVVTLNHAVSLPTTYQGQALRVIYGATGSLVFGNSSRLRLGGN
ncbi:NHL domain-containing protein [Spirosoma flavus]